MTFDDFFEKYKPVTNHLDNNASFEGVMFETFGEELEFVMNAAKENRVATYCDGDVGTWIVDGYHLVNRIGYFVTSIPIEEGFSVEVSDD